MPPESPQRVRGVHGPLPASIQCRGLQCVCRAVSSHCRDFRTLSLRTGPCPRAAPLPGRADPRPLLSLGLLVLAFSRDHTVFVLRGWPPSLSVASPGPAPNVAPAPHEIVALPARPHGLWKSRWRRPCGSPCGDQRLSAGHCHPAQAQGCGPAAPRVLLVAALLTSSAHAPGSSPGENTRRYSQELAVRNTRGIPGGPGVLSESRVTSGRLASLQMDKVPRA